MEHVGVGMGWFFTRDGVQTRHDRGPARTGRISGVFLVLSLAACVPSLAQAPSAAAPSARMDPSHRDQRLKELRRRIEAEGRTNPVDAVACGEEALQLLKGASRPKDEIWFLLALIRNLRIVNGYPRPTNTWPARGP